MTITFTSIKNIIIKIQIYKIIQKQKEGKTDTNLKKNYIMCNK